MAVTFYAMSCLLLLLSQTTFGSGEPRRGPQFAGRDLADIGFPIQSRIKDLGGTGIPVVDSDDLIVSITFHLPSTR